MSGPRGFRYALAPVLLTRRWRYEQLQRELGELHAALQQCAAALDALRRQSSTVCGEWETLTASIHGPDTFLRYHRFLQDLQEQEDRQRAALRELERQRDDLIVELAAAHRALDGIERHRARMMKEFLREHMNRESNQNDDMWNARAALRAGP